MHFVRVRSLLLACALAVLVVGCGQETMLSPTAPSGVSDSTSFAVDGSGDLAATAGADASGTLGRGGNGNGNGNGNGQDKAPKDKAGKGDGDNEDAGETDDDDNENDEGDSDDDDDDEDRDGPGQSHQEHLSGFVTAVGTDSLSVRGVTVMVDAATVIRHGNRILTLDQIRIGDHVQARGTMTGTTLLATEIKVEDTGRDNEDVEGIVSGLTGTCPTVTFTVGTTTVTTTATTLFEHATCAMLANGMTVEVRGARQADGSIVATSVEIELDEVEGAVSGLAGTCPALTFTVGTTTVTTNASTSFSDAACAAIANGMTVEVEGLRQADGSILALEVELELDEVEGVVSELAGTCPSLTFTVGTTAVSTSSTTVFSGVTCAAIANGAVVEVEGTTQANGSIAAVVVTLDEP